MDPLRPKVLALLEELNAVAVMLLACALQLPRLPVLAEPMIVIHTVGVPGAWSRQPTGNAQRWCKSIRIIAIPLTHLVSSLEIKPSTDFESALDIINYVFP